MHMMSRNPSLKSPEQLGRMLWAALRAANANVSRDYAIRVYRSKAGPSGWDAELVAKRRSPEDDAAFIAAKLDLQRRYGFRDD